MPTVSDWRDYDWPWLLLKHFTKSLPQKSDWKLRYIFLFRIAMVMFAFLVMWLKMSNLRTSLSYGRHNEDVVRFFPARLNSLLKREAAMNIGYPLTSILKHHSNHLFYQTQTIFQFYAKVIVRPVQLYLNFDLIDQSHFTKEGIH